MFYFMFVVSSGSILTSEQLQPHPHNPPHQPAGSDLPPSAKRPRTDMQPQYQTPVQQYASYLKSVYTREKQPVYDKWLPVKSKKYINLALIEKEDITKPEADQRMRDTIHGNIDDIHKSKRAMDIGQIAQLPDRSQPKCILVEGAPGVGKSTFAWKLCRMWEEGELLQQYQLVVLLRLRDKSVRDAKNISDLFQCHDRQIRQAAVEEIQKTGGKGVLLLFEGYDELPEELRGENSIFLDVIKGHREKLPFATVLITSRPWASGYLPRECKIRISQHIEILGFTKADIQSYLESTIPDDPSLLTGLKKYISCYPHIGSLMYIPLYCVFVVKVYQNSRRDEGLVPKTMTELYFSLVRDLLRCHHSKDLEVHSFEDLSKDAPDIYQQLCKLGTIAYEGIRNDQQVIFHRKDFETLGLSLEAFDMLGLMQHVRELYVGEAAAVSYNFLHLTVQEYLAAFHLSQQPVEKQIQHFREYKKAEKDKPHHFHMVLQPVEKQIEHFRGYQEHKRSDKGYHFHIKHFSEYKDAKEQANKRQWSMLTSVEGWRKEVKQQHHFHMVLRFLCGITQFKKYSNEQLNTFLIEDFGDGLFSGRRYVTFDTLHWLFEAHDNEVIAKVLGSSEIELTIHSFSQVTPFDCFVLGYCVSHSNCTWKIDLEEYNIGDEEVEMLVRGAVEEETHCTGGISEIKLGENGITSEGVKHLLKFPKQIINKLETLTVQHNLYSELCAVLAHLIPHMPHLKKLNLSNNPRIGQGGTVPLTTSLTAHNSLEVLRLYNTGIGVEDCQGLSELLSSSTSLKELIIGNDIIAFDSDANSDANSDYNALSQEAVELIISGLHHNTTLERLDMHHSHFSLQNTISLASVLRTNHTLVDLILAECDIDSDGACQLASALSTNDTLQMLDLGYNLIEVEGTTAFAEMLRTNHTLVDLNLAQCDIDSDGACQLASALSTNDTLQMLDLGYNLIEVEGTTAFAEMLRTNHTLVDLSLAQCDIDSDGACKLARALCTNDTLQELSLGGNPIGGEGATAIAEMLPKNKSLKELDLQDDSIGEEGTQKLIESLTHNTTVEELVLPEMYKSSIASNEILPPPEDESSSRVDSRVRFI